MTHADLVILLIEDSPADARYVELMLRRHRGFHATLTHVRRLESALTRLDAEHFDLVLLDLSLPDSHWIETLGHLRGAWPEVPVVVLSGFDDPPFVKRTLRHGAAAYLVKGRFDARALARAIGRATGRRLSAGSGRASGSVA